jgi:hypothetical protein
MVDCETWQTVQLGPQAVGSDDDAQRPPQRFQPAWQVSMQAPFTHDAVPFGSPHAMHAPPHMM